MNLVIIGVPYDGNGFDSGLGAAPSVWQAAGLAERLARLVARAVWVSVPEPAADRAPLQRRVAVARQVTETIRTVLLAGAFPLVLGGDPTIISLSAVSGLQQARMHPGITWFEGQSDLSRAESLALLVGQQSSPVMTEIGAEVVPEWHTLVAGPRLMSEATRESLEASAITCWTAQDLNLAGGSELGREVSGWPPVYLHLDLRVLSSALVPVRAADTPGGLSVETLIAGVQSVAAACQVGAIGVTGYDPEIDQNDVGVEISLQVIESAVHIAAD